MPIKGVSDLRRLPRLGKIRLGIKDTSKTGSPYPKPVDYFVVPDGIKEYVGEKPRELEIMLPSENPDEFAPQWYRAYSIAWGLVCIGDGETARRKVDAETGGIAGRGTRRWEWKDEVVCNPQECAEFGSQCRRVMNLMVLLPTVPGLGVWQIDTSSFHSIVSVNSTANMLKGVLGRCSMIPLTLALEPVEVTPPGQTRKTVYAMRIKTDVKLADLAQKAQLPPSQVLLPAPQVEEAPEDLYPSEVLNQAERSKEREAEESWEAPQREGAGEKEEQPAFKEERPVFRDYGEVSSWVNRCLGRMPTVVWGDMGISGWQELGTPDEAARRVSETYGLELP